MLNYRRAFVSGGACFFTVNLLERHNNDILVREIDLLRDVIRSTVVHNKRKALRHINSAFQLQKTSFVLTWVRKVVYISYT